MANIVDPSKQLQDYALGCTNPNAPPLPGGGGGNLGGPSVSADADVDPFIFDSLLSGMITSAAASIDYHGAISITSETDALHLQASTDIFVSGGAGDGGSIFLSTNADITHASDTFNVEAREINIVTSDAPQFYDGTYTGAAGGGNILIETGSGGNIEILAGAASQDFGPVGNIDITAAYGNVGINAVGPDGIGGAITLFSVPGNTPGTIIFNNTVCDFSMIGGSFALDTQDVSILCNHLDITAVTGSADSGIHMNVSNLIVSATGSIILRQIPASDPHIVGALYSVSGAVHISAG